VELTVLQAVMDGWTSLGIATVRGKTEQTVGKEGKNRKEEKWHLTSSFVSCVND